MHSSFGHVFPSDGVLRRAALDDSSGGRTVAVVVVQVAVEAEPQAGETSSETPDANLRWLAQSALDQAAEATLGQPRKSETACIASQRRRSSHMKGKLQPPTELATTRGR
jgi:hypothetical protein